MEAENGEWLTVQQKLEEKRKLRMLIKMSVCDGPRVQAGERKAETGRTAEVVATSYRSRQFK